jgi:hypothetical protein
MTQSRLARWAIAFFLVLVYAGGTYAFTASGSPGSPDANVACAPTNAARFVSDLTTVTDIPTTTTSTTTATAVQPDTTTTTTTTTSTTTELQPTTTTTTTTELQPATTTTTTTSPVTTTATLTAAPVTTTTTATATAAPVTTTATTTSPVTTTKTTTSPVTETQDFLRTVTATATCTATKSVSRPSRPTIVRFRLLHGTVPSGAPVVALFYAYPLGAKALVSISRGKHSVTVVRLVLRHEPTTLTIPAKKVETPGTYGITIVVSSGGRSSTARLHLNVLAPPTTKRSDRHRRS